MTKDNENTDYWPTASIDDLRKYRLEALKIATEIALKIEHFEHTYSSYEDPIDALFQDVKIVHQIADFNLKYIMGEK